MNAVPYRPAISDVLVKASANGLFRAKLLNSPHDALGDFNLPLEDAQLLMSIEAANLKDYAKQVKVRLTSNTY